MSSAEKPQYQSVEEYLALEEQAQTKSEYIDGWIRAMTGATIRHVRVATNSLISLGIQLKGKPFIPLGSDMKVHINREGSKRFYYPDVQVVCQSNDPLSVFQDHPVLIIEVLSPSTRRYDLDEKMAAYLTIPTLVFRPATIDGLFSTRTVIQFVLFTSGAPHGAGNRQPRIRCESLGKSILSPNGVDDGA
jgi:Uma2 family endonuclease